MINKIKSALPDNGKIWKGFTDSDDSYEGYKWDLRIFASTNPGLDPEDDINDVFDFQVCRVKAFQMEDNIKGWKYGVNIIVAVD